MHLNNSNANWNKLLGCRNQQEQARKNGIGGRFFDHSVSQAKDSKLLYCVHIPCDSRKYGAHGVGQIPPKGRTVTVKIHDLCAVAQKTSA